MTAPPGPMPAAHPYAQTNLALYADLMRRGWPDAQIVRIHHAYQLAIELFANRFRACGRPFVTHLVGTAAVAVAHLADHLAEHLADHPADRAALTDVLIAGLLHAAYDQGEFGDAYPPYHPAHRRAVAAVVGDAAESLIDRYHREPWPPDDADALADRLRHAHAGGADGADHVDDARRRVLTLRIANEYDDARDLGPLYCGSGKSQATDAGTRAALTLAPALGLDRLADELTAVLQSIHDARIPHALRSTRNAAYAVEHVRLRERLRRAIRRR